MAQEHHFRSEFFEDEELLDIAYYNTFLIATGRLTVEELINVKDLQVYLAYDPKAPETLKEVLDGTIKYFEDREEYEKCNELVRIKNNITKNDAR